MYHYVRMHGWTGACKRHVSVYDSAYVHIYLDFRTLRSALHCALQKVTFFATQVQWLARDLRDFPFVDSPD